MHLKRASATSEENLLTSLYHISPKRSVSRIQESSLIPETHIICAPSPATLPQCTFYPLCVAVHLLETSSKVFHKKKLETATSWDILLWKKMTFYHFVLNMKLWSAFVWGPLVDLELWQVHFFETRVMVQWLRKLTALVGHLVLVCEKCFLLVFAPCNNAMEDIFLDTLSTSICCALLVVSDWFLENLAEWFH